VKTAAYTGRTIRRQGEIRFERTPQRQLREHNMNMTNNGLSAALQH
jgi:hypothetical protein